MRFEFMNTKSTCELSRKEFVRMFSGALEISEDYTTWNSVDGYNGKNKKSWLFFDLVINFDVYYDSLEEMEDLMKELKNENEKKTVNKDQHFAQ